MRDYSKCVQMSYTSSTKIFILTIALVLFISVSILCEFAMLPVVYILRFYSARGSAFYSRSDRYIYLAVYSSGRLNTLSTIILICLGNTSKNKTVR